MTSLKKNFSYSVLYQLLIMLLPLVSSPYISRVLGAEGIGAFSYTHSIANFFLLFAMLGVKNYGNRTIAIVRDDKEKLSMTFWNIYGLQLSISILIILMYLAYVMIFAQEYKVIALIQLIFVISAAVDISWFFFGIEQFKITILWNGIIRILTVIGVFLLVNQSGDLWIYALLMSIGTLCAQLAVWPFLKQYVYFTLPSWKKMSSHLKPNMVLFIPVIAVSLYKIMDKFMLGALSTIEQVGFYVNAEKIIIIPMGLIIALGSVMLPRVSNLISKGDIEQSRKYLDSSMLLIMCIGSAMTFGIAGIAPVFAPFFFGAEFTVTGLLITYIAPTILFISWANVIRTQYLIPNKKDKTYIISVITGAFVNLLINFLLIPSYGAFGAAIGTIAAEFSVALIQTIMVRKKLDITRYMKDGMVFIIFGVVMFIVVRACGYLTFVPITLLMIQIIAGAIVYLALSILYLVLTKNQLMSQLLSTITSRKKESSKSA